MSKHDFYKQKFNAYYMSVDSKPSGRDRQLVAKQARQWVKNQIRAELEEELDQEYLALEIMLDKEAEEAMYCHYHGPCDRCLAREEAMQEYMEESQKLQPYKVTE